MLFSKLTSHFIAIWPPFKTWTAWSGRWTHSYFVDALAEDVRNFSRIVQDCTYRQRKLHLLTKLLSSTSYAHISTLSNVYGKQANDTFAGHKLATPKQTPDETIDKFVLNWKLLSEDCNFNFGYSWNLLIRSDTFITRLKSPITKKFISVC